MGTDMSYQGSYVIPSSSLSFPDLHLTTKVNGEIRQSQNTSELIFNIPTLIETASMGITLQPGDIIATGTPCRLVFLHASLLTSCM
jgi:2-keto-4-pentenoate hydratase/2-oxohepta-3-ene-1,7-dioic acid hydratase in catechol pathway